MSSSILIVSAGAGSRARLGVVVSIKNLGVVGADSLARHRCWVGIGFRCAVEGAGALASATVIDVSVSICSLAGGVTFPWSGPSISEVTAANK